MALAFFLFSLLFSELAYDEALQGRGRVQDFSSLVLLGGASLTPTPLLPPPTLSQGSLS